MNEKWEAFYHNERHWVVHTDTALIADCFSRPDSKFNARLIAAAPEMYRILREIQKWCVNEDFDTDIEDDIHEVFRAIDGKAEA